jgi:hypothetical protein
MAHSDTKVWLQELRLQDRFQKLPYQSPVDVPKFVGYALGCVTGTPVPGGLVVSDLIVDARGRKALDIVERWTKGQAERDIVQDVEEATDDATHELGASLMQASGPAAALWAVRFATEAASRAADIGYRNPGMIGVLDQDKDAADDVASAMVLTARLCRQAAVGNDLEAVQYQLGLLEQFWPLQPIP